MTYDDAQMLVGFLRGAFPLLTEEQAGMYSQMLMLEDAQLASTAILAGIQEWRFPPAWAEIKERIRALRRSQGTPVRTVEEAIEDSSVPLWVKRWMYARFVASPPDMRPFKEQFQSELERGVAPELGWMPDDAYQEEALSVTDAQVRAAISSSRVLSS